LAEADGQEAVVRLAESGGNTNYTGAFELTP
jgi:hypothetical protein